MPRNLVHPKVTLSDPNKNGPFNRERVEHPSFAQIGASRVTSNPGHVLYGSDFKHSHFMTITIRRSRLERDLSQDWAFAGDELIEVALSESQWAAFVSTPNSGMGTQCSLQYYKPEGQIPGIPDPPKRDAQFKAELQQDLDEALQALRILQERIEQSPGLSEKRRKELASCATTAQQKLTSSVPFVAKSFGEHIEETKDRAKTEVHAYVEHQIHRAGLDALGAPRPFELGPADSLPNLPGGGEAGGDGPERTEPQAEAPVLSDVQVRRDNRRA